MKRKLVGAMIALAVIAIATAVASASAATNAPKKNVGVRRLSGPFCISRSTGVVRSVAATRPCRKGEVRKYGVALTDTASPALPNAPAPAITAGADGATGATGATGAQGPQGPKGAAGQQGPQGDTGATGDGGAPGPQGPQGPAGPAGPPGPIGLSGTSGLGNGTTTLCVSQGGDVKFGGTNGSLCDPGHDQVLTVVIVSATQ